MGRKGTGTQRRYLQQRQGVREHLVLQLCQALPGERQVGLKELSGQPGLLGPSCLLRVEFLRSFFIYQLWPLRKASAGFDCSIF